MKYTERAMLRRGTGTIERSGNVRSLYIAPNRRTP